MHLTQGKLQQLFEQHLDYWKHQMAGAPSLLELPTDHLRPRILGSRVSTETFVINPDLSARLKSLSQKLETTLFMTMLGAFVTLLSRYSHQSDIVVGSPITSSNRSEPEPLIGFFIKTLVLRIKLEKNLSFSELLTNLRQVALDAYAHQDISWEKLVEELQLECNLSYHPIFQVMFVFQNALDLLQLTDFTPSLLDLEYVCAKFDLTLSVSETKQELVGKWVYNTDLFEASTIRRMTGHLQTLLEAIVTNPQQQIDHLPLLTSAEKHQLLVEWNDTNREHQNDRFEFIHQHFEALVEQTPDAVAVVFEDQQLTYRELNKQANKLAHYLQSLGVEAEVLVGICVERSLEMVVGLLGILKAGGAYVPFEPTDPKERLMYKLEDTQVQILLTQEKLVAALPKCNIRVVCLDSDWAKISEESANNLCTNITSGNLAYVIYTSGSTGMPKGVMNTHQGIFNRLVWMQKAYELKSEDRVLQKTPFSFDVSIWEFFWPLMTGAVLVIAQPELHKDSAYLVKLIQEQQITTIHFVPPMLQVFLEQAGLEACFSLRRVMCSGEALSFDLQERFFSRLNAELHNLYGPTEAAIDVTFWACQRESHLQIVPIGRPIANTQIHILDNNLQPVPIGVTGELHIGGVGIARGYLNRPELTSKKFIPNPFSCEPDARLYKTGDLARYLPDGNIEYLGRIDNQVKIRGFRIELLEIETVLSQHPAVRKAVVIAQEHKSHDKRLVAYIVPESKWQQFSQLRTFLKEKLPEYMVPSTFVILESLPLTQSGKVNRQALPALNQSRPNLETLFVASRTLLEEQLAQIWTQVLDINQVGVHDDFFELGGNSLLAAQLLFQIRKEFSLELPLSALFQAPTVAGLARSILIAQDSNSELKFDTITFADLQADAVLESTITPEAPFIDSGQEPQQILLTGASGFLGAFLLHELLQQTQAEIYCLVRASNFEEAEEKLHRNLKRYLFQEKKLDARIVPVLGDLSQSLLGLSEQKFRELANKIDLIYHNGAFVNLVYPYTSLRATNVLGTKEILKLASQFKVKPVHFISTIDVFQSPQYSQMQILEDDLVNAEGLSDGYAQSKWVAEKLVRAAHSRGIPACIYRPGTIIGHSQTGAAQTNDLIGRLIKGLIQLGNAPKLNLRMNLAPVDYVSKGIIHLSRSPASWGKAFHLVNSHTLPFCQLVEEIRALGYPIQWTDYEQWQAQLLNISFKQENALNPLLFLFTKWNSENQPSYLETAAFISKAFDCRNTLAGLGESIICPIVDANSLRPYLSYLLN